MGNSLKRGIPVIFNTGNACSNLMGTQRLRTYISYIRSSNLEWGNEKIDKIRNWGYGNDSERKR